MEKTYFLATTLSELETQILKELAWHSTVSDAFTEAEETLLAKLASAIRDEEEGSDEDTSFAEQP